MSAKFKWKDEYDLKITKIDKQHRLILDCMTECSSIINNKEKSKIPDLLKDLEKYSKSHFSDEVKYMKKVNYAELESHIELHDLYINKLDRIKADYENNDFISVSEVLIFLKDWFIEHIQIEDRKYTQS